MTDMVHMNTQADDKYEIIIDGEWCRYCKEKKTAERYAALNGNAHVLDIETGRIVARYR